VKNVYREQVCLKGIKGSKKGESRYKKAVLQLPEQKNQWKSFKNVCPKIELLSVRMLEETTRIGRETVRKTSVPRLLISDQNINALSPSFGGNEGSPC
jgi:hypothetical protein